jgi:hypothetical protein
MVSMFPRFQLSCYIVSCLSMASYFLHFSFGFSLSARVVTHNCCELILLLLRAINEFIHGKLDRNDVLHHSSFLLGSWIVFNFSECARFGFLLSHMQCLHFPMTIWYAGCRRAGGYKESSHQMRIQATCAAIFSPAWIICVAYRSTIMLCTMILSAGTVGPSITAMFLVLFLITTSIDLSWSTYFFSILGRPSTESICLAMAAGCSLGAAALHS